MAEPPSDLDWVPAGPLVGYEAHSRAIVPTAMARGRDAGAQEILERHSAAAGSLHGSPDRHSTLGAGSRYLSPGALGGHGAAGSVAAAALGAVGGGAYSSLTQEAAAGLLDAAKGAYRRGGPHHDPIMMDFVEKLSKRIEGANWMVCNAVHPRLDAIESHHGHLEDRLGRLETTEKLLETKIFQALKKKKANKDEEEFEKLTAVGDRQARQRLEQRVELLEQQHRLGNQRIEKLEQDFQKKDAELRRRLGVLSSELGSELSLMKRTHTQWQGQISDRIDKAVTKRMEQAEVQMQFQLQLAEQQLQEEVLERVTFSGGRPKEESRLAKADPPALEDLDLHMRRQQQLVSDHSSKLVLIQSSLQDLLDTVSNLRKGDLAELGRRVEKVEEACASFGHTSPAAISAISEAREAQAASTSALESAAEQAFIEGEGPWQQDNMEDILRTVESQLDRSIARVDHDLADLSNRIVPLQDFMEHHRLVNWQNNRWMPEVTQKLDQLWAQCQYYFSKVKEHDVHFGFFRTNFDSHVKHSLECGFSSASSTPLKPEGRSPHIVSRSLREAPQERRPLGKTGLTTEGSKEGEPGIRPSLFAEGSSGGVAASLGPLVALPTAAAPRVDLLATASIANEAAASA